MVVAWTAFVVWIIERYFTFGKGVLGLAVAQAVAPSLALSAYVLWRLRRHVVVARLMSIACAVPVAIATSRRTMEYECQIDAFCGTEYVWVPLTEYVVYGVIVALYTSGAVRRMRSSAESGDVEDRSG